MDVAYLGDLEAGLALLEKSAVIARQAGRLDDLMRVAANRTTLLDLDSRREEALAVVQASLEDAAAGGLAASYGAFLRGNSADILYHLGRWQEAEAECRLAQEWRMSALEAEWWPPLVLGLLLTESRGDEEAERLVGKALLQLETVPPGQWTGHVLRSAVSVALWSRDPASALSIAEREWPRALESDELAVVAWAASTCLEAAAAAADRGRESSDPGLIVRARAIVDSVLPQATAHVARSSIAPALGARQEAELHLAMARAHAQRVRGAADPATWDELATAWGARPMPYLEAMARWWQALAILASAPEDDRETARQAAREPLTAAYQHRAGPAGPATPARDRGPGGPGPGGAAGHGGGTRGRRRACGARDDRGWPVDGGAGDRAGPAGSSWPWVRVVSHRGWPWAPGDRGGLRARQGRTLPGPSRSGSSPCCASARPTPTASARASRRSSTSWPRAAPTATSRPASSSASAPSTSTSDASLPSSG